MRRMSLFTLLVITVFALVTPTTAFGQKMTAKEKEAAKIRKKIEQLRQKQEEEKRRIEEERRKKEEEQREKVPLSELIKKYESYISTNCKGKKNQRCADMTFSLAGAYYNKGKDDYIQGQIRYEKKIEAWQSNPMGPEPVAPLPDYSRALKLYKKAVTDYPTFSKAAEGFYQIGSIELLNGELEKSQKAYQRLVDNYPSSYRASAAHFRIAEICFTNRDFTCAMDHLNSMNDAHINADIKEMAHFRKAEIYYNRGDFDQAVEWFGSYVEKCDQLVFPKRELRGEALEYLAVSFSDMENGADAAIKYFEARGKRAYEDTVIYAVGNKNYDHGQYEQAIKALGRAIEKYPNFMGAPAAQTNIVYAYVIRRKHEKANKARELLVDNYGKGSKWQGMYSSNAVAIAKADAEVQKALGSIAIYYHAAAQAAKEPEKRLDHYKQALRRYVQFIDTYPGEKWKVYEYKYNVAEAYFTLKDYRNAAACYDFVASADLDSYPKFKDDIDTVGMDPKEIEQARAKAQKNSPLQISQMEAGFNAIVSMDSLRVSLIAKGKLNEQQAYALPETKQFITYIHNFQSRFPKSEYASEILFLAADVQFKGKDYRGTIAECQTILSTYGKKEMVNTETKKSVMVKDTTTFKRATKLLADAYSKNEQFDLAVVSYDSLINYEAPGSEETKKLVDLASAAIFRKAEKFREKKNYDLAEKEFKRIAHKYPTSNVADKGFFEAAVTRESDSSWAKAAANFEELATRFPKSELRQKSFVRAGENYAKAKMWPEAAKVMLASAKTYKKDPDFAVGALAKASEYYKEGKDLIKSADMFYEIFKHYPTDSTAPTALYNAGLMYEEAEAYDRAITTYSALGNKYPTSPFAPSGYFSIGLVYEKQGKVEDMAGAFVDYAQKFPDNRSSQLKALLKATEAYMELSEDPKNKYSVKSGDNFGTIAKKLGVNYNDFVALNGKNPKNPRAKVGEQLSYYELKARSAVEQATLVYDKHRKKDALDPYDGGKAFFILADMYRADFEAIKLTGKNQKEVDANLKKKVAALKPVIEYYTEAIKQQVAEWTIKSTYSIGLTYRDYASTIRSQQLFGDETKRLGAQIQILSGDIQKGYDEAIGKFAKAIEFARENGITESYVDTAELYLMETWYMKGYAFEESGDILRNSPIPEGFSEEEEMAYLDALEEYYVNYISQALPIYEAGTKHAVAMMVGKNEWTEKIQEHAGIIAAYFSEEIQYVDLDAKKAEKMATLGPVEDPIDKKVNKELASRTAAITQVMSSGLEYEQKLQRLIEINNIAKREIEAEEAKIKELKNKLGMK